jgi:outer membrane protein assembly factor BamB
MNPAAVLAVALLVGTGDEEGTGVKVTEIAGTWAGSLTHAGETEPLALLIEPGEQGKVQLSLSVPVVHLAAAPMGTVTPKIEGDDVHLGPFDLRYDRAAGTLSGALPKGLAPFYEIPFVLHRVDGFEVKARPAFPARRAEPVWTFDAGSPLWAGATCAAGRVYAGGDDGRLHALDAATGEERWGFAAGGPIRTRATFADGSLYFQADDGWLYKLDAAGGKQVWRTLVTDKKIERLPFDDPKSRYDRFGADVTVADGRLYVGTHDGRVLALEPSAGQKVWEFAAGDSVLGAPAAADGRVFFGSFDGSVYALDAATGALVWKRDTHGAVVSTPAVADGRVVVGNRSYDLVALDESSGEPAWTRYLWFSWVESSATIRDRVAYVGSSDAAALYAFDVRTGQRQWKTDVYGWAWGQPAVTSERVYVGTASQKGYLAGHQGLLVAVERASGHPVWYYAAVAPEKGAYGFPGSPAVGDGRVFATALDGRVYAFVP